MQCHKVYVWRFYCLHALSCSNRLVKTKVKRHRGRRRPVGLTILGIAPRMERELSLQLTDQTVWNGDAEVL